MVAPHKVYEGLASEELLRTFGRSVYLPTEGASRLAAWRQIVASDEPARVDDVWVSAQWAKMLLNLYEELDPAKRLELTETSMPDIAGLLQSWNA